MIPAVARIVVALTSLVLLVSCSGSSSSPTLQSVVPIGRQGVGTIFVPTRVWTTTLGAYCLDKPGSATIAGVDLVGAESMNLDSFGVTGHCVGDVRTSDDARPRPLGVEDSPARMPS